MIPVSILMNFDKKAETGYEGNHEKVKNIFYGKFQFTEKMISIYFIVSVLPIFFICMLSYVVYYKGVRKEAYALIEQNMKQHEVVITERLDSYESILYEIVCDSTMIKLAKSINNGDNEELIVTKGKMDEILRNYIYTYDGIRSIAYLSDSDYVGYSRWYSSASEVKWSDTASRKRIYNKVLKNPHEITYVPGINLAKSNKRKDYVTLMGFQIQDLYTKENQGVLVVALDDNILNFDGKSRKINEGEREKTGVTTIIVDDRNRILAGEYSSYITKNYNEFKEEVFEENKDIYEYREEIGDTGWQIINLLNQRTYLEEINKFTAIVIMLAIMITLFFWP